MERRCAIGDDCREPGFLGSDAVPFCPSCLRAAALEIPDLYEQYVRVARRLVPAGGASVDEPTSRPKPSSRPPLNLAADALMRRITMVCGQWEDQLRDHLGLEQVPGNVRSAFAVHRACALFAGRLLDLIAMPPRVFYDCQTERLVRLDGIHAVINLRALRRRAIEFLGTEEAVIRLPGDCPGCGALALHRHDGGDVVWCEQCKRSWPYPEYERYVSLMTDDRVVAKTRTDP